MAYDSYRDPPYEPARPGDNNLADERPYVSASSYQPPYPSQYVTDQIQMPQPRMPSPTFQGSSATAAGSAGSRIDDAVASAVNQANPSTHVSPELISQVTATVIQQLKAYGLGSPQTAQQPQPQHQPQPQPQPQPQQQQQPQPQPQPQQQPPPPQSAPLALDTTYYEPPPSARYRNSQSPDTREAKPPTHSVPLEVRDGQRKASPEKRADTVPETRPTVPESAPSLSEMTTLEKIWGRLFQDGKPTPRLGQLLRGIAVHLIEDYPPGNTIVVIPEKMQKYYADTRVSTDTYPWQDIFDDQASSISRIYRDVEAEHHLVQDPLNLSSRPDKPGLTPRGFERWFTLMIQANPDREFARLKKTVLDMPINNPDDKKERFPKELPRRLFPNSPDLKILEKLEASIVTHSGVDLPHSPPGERSKSPPRKAAADKSPSRAPTVTERPPPPPPPPAATAAATAATAASLQDREPQCYSSAASSAVLEDDEEGTLPPRPIERERKPYSAQPGGGKVYKDVSDHPPKTEVNKGKEFLSSPTTATHRQSHSYGQEPPQLRSGQGAPSGYNGHSHHASISSKSGRTRSSSVGVNGPGDYRHSEPDLNSFDPDYVGSGTVGHYKTTSTTGDGYDDGRRYRDYDRDDARDYEVLRERERDRERRYHDHPTSRSTWTDEDYYRGLLGGQGGGPVGGHDYKYR